MNKERLYLPFNWRTKHCITREECLAEAETIMLHWFLRHEFKAAGLSCCNIDSRPLKLPGELPKARILAELEFINNICVHHDKSSHDRLLVIAGALELLVLRQELTGEEALAIRDYYLA